MIKLIFLYPKTFFKFLILTTLLFQLSSCGIYRPVDARKVSPNADERIKQNQAEGKGFSLGNLGRGKGGDFQFASSNEMWRATLEVLDFVPLSNVDYGGGIIVTDWYQNSTAENDSIKLMVQFLTNEIRADGILVKIYTKNCKTDNNCKTQLLETSLNAEIKIAILKKAALLKKLDLQKNN
jgi:hypothetical protein